MFITRVYPDSHRDIPIHR